MVESSLGLMMKRYESGISVEPVIMYLKGILITSLESSNYGWSIVSWSYDSTLRIWDVSNGTCDHVLEGHSGGVTGVVELRDGRIVSCSDFVTFDKTLRIWDISSGTCDHVPEGHSEEVEGIVELRDGLYTECSEKAIFWAPDMKPLCRLQTTFDPTSRFGFLTGFSLPAKDCLQLRYGTKRISLDNSFTTELQVWVYNGGETTGPFSLADILKWQAEGSLQKDCWLCMNGTSIWKRPGELLAGSETDCLRRILN